jgi:hypothetical protein
MVQSVCLADIMISYLLASVQHNLSNRLVDSVAAACHHRVHNMQALLLSAKQAQPNESFLHASAAAVRKKVLQLGVAMMHTELSLPISCTAQYWWCTTQHTPQGLHDLPPVITNDLQCCMLLPFQCRHLPDPAVAVATAAMPG